MPMIIPFATGGNIYSPSSERVTPIQAKHHFRFNKSLKINLARRIHQRKTDANQLILNALQNMLRHELN